MQPRIDALLVGALALNRDRKRIVQELERTFLSLLPVFHLQGVRKLEQGFERPGPGHYQIAEMRTQRGREIQCIESLGKYAVKF